VKTDSLMFTKELTMMKMTNDWDRAGLKPPAQYMEALWAGARVRLSGLPRTEAGIYPAAESSAERVVPLSVKTLIFYH